MDPKEVIDDLKTQLLVALMENSKNEGLFLQCQEENKNLLQENARLKELNVALRERGDTYKENWRMCDERLRYVEGKDNSSRRKRKKVAMYDPTLPPREV